MSKAKRKGKVYKSNVITCPCGCVDGIKRPKELTKGWWERFLNRPEHIRFRGEGGYR
jgi:hypothetical protein